MPGEEMKFMPQAARKRGRHDLWGTSNSAIAGTGRPARFNDGQRRRPLPWSGAGRKYGSEQAAYLPRVCIPAGQCSAINHYGQKPLHKL